MQWAEELKSLPCAPSYACSGRRNACVTYCITYILSCVTKHSSEFFVLMVGRILGGIATSLLFSAFESWLVAEHFKVRKEPVGTVVEKRQ